MSQVSEEEVLLLWRAVRAFRSGPKPGCAARGRPPVSACPLHATCPRWRGQPDDRLASMEESTDATEQRRAVWPCTRLMDLLSPDLTQIGP